MTIQDLINTSESELEKTKIELAYELGIAKGMKDVAEIMKGEFENESI